MKVFQTSHLSLFLISGRTLSFCLVCHSVLWSVLKGQASAFHEACQHSPIKISYIIYAVLLRTQLQLRGNGKRVGVYHLLTCVSGPPQNVSINHELPCKVMAVVGAGPESLSARPTLRERDTTSPSTLAGRRCMSRSILPVTGA